MKMPEGWEKLKDCLESMHADDDGDYYAYDALELMKEMAEALEGITSRKGKNLESGLFEENQAGRVLEKFLRWK